MDPDVIYFHVNGHGFCRQIMLLQTVMDPQTDSNGIYNVTDPAHSQGSCRQSWIMQQPWILQAVMDLQTVMYPAKQSWILKNPESCRHHWFCRRSWMLQSHGSGIQSGIQHTVMDSENNHGSCRQGLRCRQSWILQTLLSLSFLTNPAVRDPAEIPWSCPSDTNGSCRQSWSCSYTDAADSHGPDENHVSHRQSWDGSSGKSRVCGASGLLQAEVHRPCWHSWILHTHLDHVGS